MKARELECDICRKLDDEKATVVVSILEEKQKEIEKTKVILNKLEKQYQKLLNKDIDEIYYDRCW
ncbi:MAG: hypothetical protein ACOCRK_10495 [bacterium]